MKNSKIYGSKIQIYTLKNGDISYYIFYRNNEGKKERKKIGRKSEGITEKTCINQYNSVIMELRHGIDLSIKKGERFMIFDTLAIKNFKDKELHNVSNYSSQLHYLKHIKPYIGADKIANLSNDKIIDIQVTLKKQGYSNSTNNRTISLIKTIINYALKINLINLDLIKHIKLIKNDDKRERILSSIEVKELYKIVSAEKITTKIFTYLSLSTGARVESVLALQMKHINFENKSILLHDFKRNKNYSGVLSNDVLEILNKHFKNARPNIYLTSMKKQKLTYSAYYARFKKILKAFNEGINKTDRKNKIVLHSLRHTFASHLTMDGTGSLIVQNLMNHSDSKMTERYTHLYENIGANKINSLYENG